MVYCCVSITFFKKNEAIFKDYENYACNILGFSFKGLILVKFCPAKLTKLTLGIVCLCLLCFAIDVKCFHDTLEISLYISIPL